MPRLLLLRAYMDTSDGGYYSPLHSSGCVSLLPMPEKKRIRRPPAFLRPRYLVDPCTGGSLDKYYVSGCFERYPHTVHNDPRPDLGFYTGYYMPRGRVPHREPKKLRRGDILLFMAGLAEYPEDTWRIARSVRDVQKILTGLKREGKAGIYIVSGLVVEEVLDISQTGWNRALKKYPQLRYSPHYYRRGDKPVAVIGRGFYLNPPLMIYSYKTGLTRKFIELIGEDNAVKVSRNNFRRSAVIEVPYNTIKDIVYLA